MKVIAKYLPQFHQIKENDEWWGKGFTEWTTVKNATKYYADHKQPRIPLNDNYYNLLDKRTMEWQAELMKRFEIDGICIYHYWFKNGRQILEKPAENLLQWTDIDMPFCFCWANETWARSWSNIPYKNAWADIYEKEQYGNGILLEQEYGREQQWEAHFEYLIPFFSDSRYIKIDGKPLFVLYKTSDISCLIEMLDCWERLAHLHGLPGIYVIGSGCNASGKSRIDAELYYQPARSNSKIPHSWKYMKNGIQILEYDDVWNNILLEPMHEKVYFEGVVSYDDTPRRGKNGLVVEHATPEKFSYYLTELLAKSASFGSEIVFLNAWNEWGEGMHLEPDTEYGTRYLSAVSDAKKSYIYRIKKYDDIHNSNKTPDQKAIHELKKRDRDSYYLNILDRWIILREKGYSIASQILQMGYKRIAVYGYGILGRHLCAELSSSEVTVEYLIDQLGNQIHTDYKVYLPSDSTPEVEAIIITTYDYEEVYQRFRNRKMTGIISLETVLCQNPEWKAL